MDTTRSVGVPELLTTNEAAKMLRHTPQTLRRWRWAGTGPRFLKGNPCLYDMRDLEAWIESRKVRSTTEASERERRAGK